MHISSFKTYGYGMFKESTVILRPITVFEGESSSGKTAMIELLETFLDGKAKGRHTITLNESDTTFSEPNFAMLRRKMSLPFISHIDCSPSHEYRQHEPLIHNDVKKLAEPFVDISHIFASVYKGYPETDSERSLYGILAQICSLRRAIVFQKSLSVLDKPEKHICEKTQAFLATILFNIAKEYNVRFIVETHGQHIKDRLRIEIRRGNDLAQKNVSFVNFHRFKTYTKVNSILFDKMANMEGTYAGYSGWYIDEYKRLMGFEDKGD